MELNEDDDIETTNIPFAAAVPMPEETREPQQDPYGNEEVVVMASLVDSNDPKAMRTFQEAPVAQRAAVDVCNIPKKGVGWTAGFQRDWLAHLLHILLLIVGFSILVGLCSYRHRSGGEVWILGLWYVVFLLEAMFSSYGCALRNMSTHKNVSEYLNHLRRSEPSLFLSMECYHYISRTRYYRDKDGNDRAYTVTDKIVTFRTHEQVRILSCKDATQNTLTEADLKDYQLTKIHLTKSFVADTPFKEQVNVFRMRHASRDLHYEMKIHYEIPNFKSYVMSRVQNDDDDSETLIEVSWINYMLAHLFVVPALVYRLWLSAQTNQRHMHVEKHILTAGPSPEALHELQNLPTKTATGTVLGGLANLFLGRH